MAYRLITPPTLLPVARGEAKAHIILDHNCDDSLIDGLILAAKEKVESDTRRQLVTATWELSLDKFPVCDGGIVYLEKPPIQSVSFVKYIDGDGVLQTLDASNYQLDSVSEPGRLKPAYGYSWPSHRCQLNAVTVRFVAGYGVPSAVPQTARHMMYLLIGHWYANREAVGNVGSEIELAYNSLLYSLKWGL